MERSEAPLVRCTADVVNTLTPSDKTQAHKYVCTQERKYEIAGAQSVPQE